MKNFYEVGKIYIWQNCNRGFEYLNGTETTVIGQLVKGKDQEGNVVEAQETDTPGNGTASKQMFARKGVLRPKNPPSGEKSIHEIISGKLNINIDEKEPA